MGDSILVTVVVLISAAAIGAAIYGASKQEQEWLTFKQEHNCKVVGKKKGYSVTTVGSQVNPNGTIAPVMGTSFVPDQTAWLCDDGVTYWR